MRMFVGLALFTAFAASAAAQSQGIRPFEADAPNWENFAGDYYGSPDCTRDRRRANAERAIEICTRFIEGNAPRPAIAAALIVRGERYEDQENLQAAQADFERAAALYSEEIAEAPRAAGPYAARSEAYNSLNRFEEALADADRAISFDSGLAAAHYRRGHLNFRLGNFAAAIADYDRTARLGERMADRGSIHVRSSAGMMLSPTVTAARCEARAAAGVELNRAETLCRNAMLGSREHFSFSRGFLRFKQGDLEGAWADFNTAAENDDANGYPLYGRGVAAIRLGRKAEGEADVARARELEGDDLNFYANAGLVP